MADRGEHWRRRLTAEELALWRNVTRNVKPRSGGGFAVPEAAETHPPDKAPSPVATPPKKTSHEARTSSDPRLFAMAPLDPQLRRQLARGRAEIDGVLDLHGSTQEDAHRRIIDFLVRNQDHGAKLVLIVTGKGRSDAQAETGVLRRNAPLWLRAPALRALVLGVEEAAPVHGGSGALYVRLRKRRGV